MSLFIVAIYQLCFIGLEIVCMYLGMNFGFSSEKVSSDQQRWKITDINFFL